MSVVLLAISTVAAAVFAWLNFVQEGQYQQPTDGVTWVEDTGGLRAHRAPTGSPGQMFGIRAGDLLVSVNDIPTQRLADLVREMYRTHSYGTANYEVVRSGVRVVIPVILGATDQSLNQGWRLIALVYLSIGLYVLFRRWTAPRSTHFYVFCLASFVMYAFKYTGKFNDFDWAIYWSEIVAGALQPALFLHFALAFDQERDPESDPAGRQWLIRLCYLPAVLVVALRVSALEWWSATGRLDHRLDQIAYGYLALYYVLAGLVFFVSYRRTTIPLRRQQLKWLTRGTVLAVAPFTLFYVIPYLADLPAPALLTKLAGISLVFLPLTFSWAIVRYRLMDVDLIFKRGVTYTLATAAVVGLYFGAVSLAGEVVHTRLPSFGSLGLIVTITLASLLFDPMKRAIQSRVDRIFDRRRYDYRQTLMEFGRGLSSETDLEALLNALIDRLSRTLTVARVAVIVAEDAGIYTLTAGHGLPQSLYSPAAELDFGFLDFDLPGAGSHIFLENPQQALHLNASERRTASLLDVNYYLPCRVQSRTIAVIGLGRTGDGDFLSSEDVELLESLASYIGIALQNARLYASLEQKITEYERLKEFNENIVESINVGIVAVDLEDRIESWNAQMEVLFALPRAEALGQTLENVVSPSFVEEFHQLKETSGVHNFYKFRIETREGEVRTANVAIAPMISKDFKIVGRIILIDDITDRTELEAQLTQAEKLSSIGLLAAGVAHEVNTPLAVISSYAQMLAKQVRGDVRVAPLLDKITQQTFRASEIVNGLLNFSRTSGAEFRDLDLNGIIEETLTLLEHQLKTSRIELDVHLQADLPAIRGNPGKLQQVFLNLFLNAKDAMTGGGRLTVKTEVNGGEVSVRISDTGSGIAPEHVQRIYDPFFTTKSTPREGQRKGTGLGLSVTYGIIQEHAGKIQVESQIGSGTTFYLEFPTLRKPVHA